MARLCLCSFAVLTVLLAATACSPDQSSDVEKRTRASKIEPPLRDHLERPNPEEMIPIVLILERQVTEEEKGRLFSQIDTENRLRAKEQQRELLIHELKRVAEAEQAQVLQLLNSWEADGKVRSVQPLWLANVIGLEARRSAIEQLAKLQGIESIHLDIPQPVLGPVAQEGTQSIHVDIPRPVRGPVAWGVTQIRAPQVWEMKPRGFDGKGVVVAILDFGVNYRHSDLIHRMWINSKEDRNHDNQFSVADNNGVDDDRNGYADDVVGWNFAGPNNDPVDLRGHGTHVAGIVAGEGTEEVQTGVAPGARIMALRVSNTLDFAQELMSWKGMQYALENHADVVNFSIGWLNDWKPHFAIWRQAVKNLADCGVLFVAATGNGDAVRARIPNIVRTPGRVPAALTVGATDKTDAIAPFSNKGPVTWRTVSPFLDYHWGPGLRKPDVTAPGVQITSTLNSGGYISADGTSMAAPHVAGLAALLLDKDPSLTPYELRLIIEETSVNVGAASVFGWGRIDAPTAINYRISPLPYDLAIDRSGRDIWVDNNDDGTPDMPAAGTNHLYARIRNLGGRVVSAAEVRFYSFGTGRAGCGSGPRKHLGSYTIPILGPASSRHETALAVIHWTLQAGEPRCIGVEIAAHPPNRREPNLSNNTGFREL